MLVDDGVQKKASNFHLLVIPFLLDNVGYYLSGTIFTELIVYRTCLVPLNTNATECLKLLNNDGSPAVLELEAKVEPYASTIVMTKSLMENIPPAVVSLFLGPWSDRCGRKPLFLAVYTGSVIKCIILCLMSTWTTSPWFLLVASVSENVAGGLWTLGMVTYCYVSDTTSEKNRMVQMALLQVISYGGYVMGAFAGPAIYEHCGYTTVFGVAAICEIIALAYTYFYLPETVKITSKESLSGIFKISYLKEIATSFSVQRENIIWLEIFTLVMISMIGTADLSIEFLFTRVRLGWDVQHYSYYNAATAVILVAGLCVVSLRIRFPGISDVFLVGVGLVSSLGAAITKSLTWKSWHMYLASCFAILSEISVPTMRSLVSKSVPPEDYGKVFSLITLLEVLSCLIGTPMYTLIYSHYLPPIYPSPVHLYSSAVYLLLIICVVCLEVLIRTSRGPTGYTATPQQESRS